MDANAPTPTPTSAPTPRRRWSRRDSLLLGFFLILVTARIVRSSQRSEEDERARDDAIASDVHRAVERAARAEEERLGLADLRAAATEAPGKSIRSIAETLLRVRSRSDEVQLLIAAVEKEVVAGKAHGNDLFNARYAYGASGSPWPDRSALDLSPEDRQAIAEAEVALRKRGLLKP